MKNKVSLVVLFVGVIFCTWNYSCVVGSSTAELISSCLLYPVLRAQHFFIEPVREWWHDRVSLDELQCQYIVLQNRVDALLKENIALRGGNRYNEDIKELVKFKRRYAEREHLVQVLARHLSDQHQFFLVNAGSRQGIEKDMVALYGNFLIGRVEQVYPWYCKVYLITDAECKVASVCSTTGASGINQGMNKRNCMSLRYVSHLDSVTNGDYVLSSGEGLVFPQGFALGTIVNIERGDLFYTIDVEPLINFESLRYCALAAKSDIDGDV